MLPQFEIGVEEMHDRERYIYYRRCITLYPAIQLHIFDLHSTRQENLFQHYTRSQSLDYYHRLVHDNSILTYGDEGATE